MDDRAHSGPGTCLAEVGEEASLTGKLREWLRAGFGGELMPARPSCLPDGASMRWHDWRRIIVTLPREDLDRLQRIHYRRRRPGARAPTSFAVYLPEGVVEFRPTTQEAP